MRHKKQHHHKKDIKQRHCIIVGCIAIAVLCFLTLFSQYTDNAADVLGAAILKNKCDTAPSTYVLIGSNDNYLYALDADKGCVAWKYNAEGDIKSRPTVYGSTVYVGTTENSFAAVSKADGTELWTADTGKVYGSAAADSSYAYVGDNLGALSAYASGAVAWTYTGHNIKADIQLDNNILYIVDEYLKVGTVRAIDGATHAQKWAFSAKSQIMAPPLITSDALYVPSNENTLYKINKQYGVTVWTFKTAKSIRTKPVINNGILYFGSNDGYVYAVNSKDGSLVWKYPTNSEISASAAVDDTAVYVATMKKVYALNKQAGTLVWEANLGKIYGNLALFNGKLLVPSADYSLYCLDAVSGKTLWSYKTSGALYAGVAIG